MPTDEAIDGDRFEPPKYGVRELGPARMIAETPGGVRRAGPLLDENRSEVFEQFGIHPVHGLGEES